MGRKRKRDWKTAAGAACSVVVFCVILTVFARGMTYFGQRADQEGAETLRNAVTRACVQCYAIEGRYPPDVAYLEENYGIQIDRRRYHVFYNGFASNIMPEITINQAAQSLHISSGKLKTGQK